MIHLERVALQRCGKLKVALGANMQNQLFELSVRIQRNGRTSKIREYGLDGLTYIEGRAGTPYTVHVKNNSASRVLVVVSVDGIGVVDGQPATDASRGYIVDGLSAVEIQGWRSDLNTTHDFVFGSRDDSYRASTGQGTNNCGIIACRVFAEECRLDMSALQDLLDNYRARPSVSPPHVTRPWYVPSVTPYVPPGSMPYPAPWQPIWVYDPSSAPVYATCASSYSQPTTEVSSAEIPEFTMGTSWGAQASSRAHETEFKRGRCLAEMSIYYTDATSLQEMGIRLENDAVVVDKASLPQGFTGFCRVPRK